MVFYGVIGVLSKRGVETLTEAGCPIKKRCFRLHHQYGATHKYSPYIANVKIEKDSGKY